MHTRPAAHLELVPATACGVGLATHHVRSTSTSAIALFASVAMLLAVGCVGVLGAILVVGVLVGISFGTTRMPGVRQFLDRNRLERARERQLPRVSPVRQLQYRELRALADGIEAADLREAERFELDAMLDYFVRLSVGHQRCVEALGIAGDVAANETLCAQRPPTTRRQEIADRLIRHQQECALRLEQITDEIGAADGLIRLLAQRVACAGLDPVADREIEARLAELDAIDEAMSQVST